MNPYKRSSLLTCTLALLLVSCSQVTGEKSTDEPVVAGMPNPASVYCEEQGGALEIRTETDGGQYGVCIFDDGSECEEWAFFNGECQPGGDSASTLEITDSIEARDAVVSFLLDRFAIDPPGAWEENSRGLVGSTTTRFISPPWVVEVTTPVVPPGTATYTVVVSQVSTGFYWEGSINAFGEINETEVSPPATVLNTEQARDAAVAYLVQTYGFPSPEAWEEQSMDTSDAAAVGITYTAGDWVAEVIFAPAAPIVPSYRVIVDDVPETFRWEGEISARGEITEIAFTQE